MTDLQHNAVPAPRAHLVLLITALLPLCCPASSLLANVMVLITAAVTVYVGSWRSLRNQEPVETMTHKDAMRFPIIGSGVLLGLFLLLKYLPEKLFNLCITIYFVTLGIVTVAATIEPFIVPFVPENLQHTLLFDYKIKIPVIMSEELDLQTTVPGLIATACSGVFCLWYGFTKYWFANNVLAISYAVQALQFLSVDRVPVAAILLSGLFVYDIFWVFFTPVMVSVAKKFDAPIKLLFPRAVVASGGTHFSMLGLGDIVIPGLFVALMLRYDQHRGHSTDYFKSSFVAYIGGLLATISVMNWFQAAQPALLYIVPALLLTALAHAALRKETVALWTYCGDEDGKKTADEQKVNDKNADKKRS